MSELENISTRHQPILLETIVKLLTDDLPPTPHPRWIVDCTLGGGGHTGGLLTALRERGLNGVGVIALDQDQRAVERGRLRFREEIASGRLEIHRCPFSHVAEKLAGRKAVGLLADLGFSSDQVDDPDRGLSFLKDGPLDMRLDGQSETTCFDWLHHVSQDELEKVIREWGEERFAGRIARTIIELRNSNQLKNSTVDLAERIRHAVPSQFRFGRLHPATRTFQALRIAVNDELGELDRLLGQLMEIMENEGRVALMSFHSLEDRRVKWAFKEYQKQGLAKILTKKPIIPTEKEIDLNSRARSAKLRMMEKSQ